MSRRPDLASLLCVLLLTGCQATLPARRVPPQVAGPEPTSTPEATTPVEPSVPPTPAPASDATTPDAATPVDAVAVPASDDTDRAGADVFAALRARLDPGDCSGTSERNPWYRRYRAQSAGLSRQLQKALPLLDFVSRQVEAEGLPAEFALMPLVESGYRADALGVGKPAGLWQLIPSTARNHGVRFAQGFDGRLSPLDSTQAAHSYLKVLAPEFEQWQAIAMAYNAGENRVRRALKRFGPTVSALDRKPATLSPVTYHYVAKIEALSCLILQPPPELHLPESDHFPPLFVARIPDDITDMDDFATATGMTGDELHRFNPGYRRKLIAPGAPREVLLPATARARLAARQPPSTPAPAVTGMSSTTDAASSPLRHEVRAGDTLWSIARRYGLSLADLVRLNGLNATSILRPGQSLRLSP